MSVLSGAGCTAFESEPGASRVAGRNLEGVASVAELNPIVHVEFIIERTTAVYDEVLRACDLPIEVTDQGNTVQIDVLIGSVIHPGLLRRAKPEGLRTGAVYRVLARPDEQRHLEIFTRIIHEQLT